jgi:murein DD-endopeptidase MepM/ murein hydrolase activator NlpD
VAGAVSFTDTWGAPRSGGRSHKGVDMIAARGTPIVAIFSGSVYRTSNSSLGGLSIYFTSDAGDLYYYAHLDGFGDITPGERVPAGYVLGYNGSSGNAPDYLPHLHFEYHPGGGSAVNPYPLVRDLC